MSEVQRQERTWEEAVPHNHENPQWFNRGCLRCQDEARLKYMHEVHVQRRPDLSKRLSRLGTGQDGFVRIRWLSSLVEWKRRYVYHLSTEDVAAITQAAALLAPRRKPDIQPGLRPLSETPNEPAS